MPAKLYPPANARPLNQAKNQLIPLIPTSFYSMPFSFFHIHLIMIQICFLRGESEKLTKERYQQIVDELLARLDSRMNVILECTFPGKRLVGGKYSMNTHSITMYTDNVTEQCLRMYGEAECLPEYFKVVLAHEMGHAHDNELEVLAGRLDEADKEERSRLMLRIEENAWKFARTILYDVAPAFLEEIERQSLAPYYKAVEEEAVPV